MSLFGPRPGSILYINMRFALSLILAFAAWQIWGWFTSPKYWGWGFIAIMCGLSAFGCFLDASRKIAQHLERDRQVGNYPDKGAAPKSDRLVDAQKLRDGGLLK